MTNSTAQQKLLEQITDDILCGNFKPRERLVESDLMEKYGATRNAVRNAFKELQALKLVIHQLNCGVAVAEVTEKDAMNLYKVRVLLESYAAHQVMVNLTDPLLEELKSLHKKFIDSVDGHDFRTMSRSNVNFHERIYQISQNQVIKDLIRDLRTRSNLLLYQIWRNSGQLDTSMRDHEGLLAALKRRDIEAFIRINSKHILASLQHYLGKTIAEMGFENLVSRSFNTKDLIEILA